MAAAAARRYRLPVMELLGLSDTAELTISLPAAPTEDLSIDLHATTLVVAPPTEDPVTELPEDDLPEWEGVPRLADVQTEETSDTGALIGKLWEATEESLVLEEDWTPEQFESDERAFNPWWIAAGVAVALGVIVSVWAVTNSGGRTTEDLLSDYGAVTADLREATQAVGTLMDPMNRLDVESSDLSEGAAAIADLEATARRATDIASEAPPTGPFQEIDPDIEPIRANLRTGAERAADLELRLGQVLTYRMLLDRSFLLPPLPYAITPDNIPALGVEISLAVADTLEAIGQLPEDQALLAHRGRAEDFAERLESWQIDYLEAVRNDDLEATSVLIEEFETGVAELRSSIAGPLGNVANWAEQQLDYIGAALDRIDDLLADS